MLIGCLSGVFGVRGWLKLHSFTEPREKILEYVPWRLSLGRRTWEVTPAQVKQHGKALLVQFEELRDRDQAATWVGAEVYTESHRLPDLEDDEFYWSELEGMEVVNQHGVSLGRVDHLLETGANDVLVVEGERQRLIPFTRGHAITAVDRAARRIEVDWDEDF